jgi:Protein of unknown function (DUF2950)
MHTNNAKLERVERFWLFWLPRATAAALFLTLMMWAQAALAQTNMRPTYSSAEKASQALYDASKNGNEQSVLQILGGRKELASSGDPLEDKFEREQFTAKYEQMHRLVRQTDGSMVLYVGAENWPFPVPIVSKNGSWFFDPDAGAQEILFRQIGENELTAIDTCRALVSRSRQTDSSASDDDVLQYVRSVVASESGSGNQADREPFHGYYFRPLSRSVHQASASQSKSEPAFVAYPTEYRATGVMTFVVTRGGVVYEKDLGPKTADLAQKIATWHRDSSWHAVE